VRLNGMQKGSGMARHANTSYLVNPDVWMASGRKLGVFKMPDTDEAKHRFATLLGDDEDLAMHLGRWMSRMGELIGEATVGATLTEEQLRAAWEQTREPPQRH
jgi:hypothetical protein